MVVKKYTLNQQTNLFEWVTDYHVTEDKAFVEMSMDPPYAIQLDNPTRSAPFLYEAGNLLPDETFDLVFIWQSENGNLFN